MKILSVNAGSSSLKFTLFEMPEGKELINGYFEKIGLEDSFYTIKINGNKEKKVKSIKNHDEAVSVAIDEMILNKVIDSLEDIDAVGHRVVHGGETYSESVIIDDEVIDTITDLIPLAPLHNPANLTGIKAFMKALKDKPNVGVFDTAFHQTMDELHYIYPIPYEFYENNKVRKYGFHGTSHKYITQYMQKELNREDVNLIICHIGSGGSLCAVKDGKSFDTTMGFTPNAGIMMGTRCGDIDYSIIPYIMKENNITLEEVDNVFNKKSGLLGIGGASDHRDIEAEMEKGNPKAILANDMYVNKIANYIGEYFVELEGKVDAIIFTAGLGENAINFRKEIIEKLNCLGIHLDSEKNNSIAGFKDKKFGIISSDDSKVKVFVVPTNEELMIATDTYNLVN